MGASGKALNGAGKRRRGWVPAQSKDDGLGPPPHPLTARSGQRYWPRHGDRKRPFQVGRIDRAADKATGRRLDGAGEKVRLALPRLLATRPDGQGLHYSFLGFDSRRYKTFALVMAVGESDATLVLPEWHPGRPVAFPARLLPAASRRPGAWMTCTADLSQGRAAWLNVADLASAEDPGEERCHRATYVAPDRTPAPERPAAGRGCGDIVVELQDEGLGVFLTRGGLLDVHVYERANATRGGDRVYLAQDGLISAFLVVERTEQIPSGMFVRCRPAPVAMTRAITTDGRNEAYHWRDRWWQRELEDEPGPALTVAYDRDRHSPDYVWARRVPASINQPDGRYRTIL